MGIFALTGILLALFTSTVNSEDGKINNLNNVNTNKPVEETTANITITMNSTTKEATTDTTVYAKNTDEETTANITITGNSTNNGNMTKPDDEGTAANITIIANSTLLDSDANSTVEATSDAVVPAVNTTQEAAIDTTVSANNTVEGATTDTTIPAKNTTEEATSDTVVPATNTTEEATSDTVVPATNTTEEATSDTVVPANNTDNVNTTIPEEETTANITITANNTDNVNTTKPDNANATELHGDGANKTSDAGDKHGDGANGTTDAGDKDNVDTATPVEQASTDTTTTANNSTEQAPTDTTVPADNTHGDGANGTTVTVDMDDVNTIKPDEETTANTINTANITDMPKATTETTTTKKPDDKTTTKATTTTYPLPSTIASGDAKKDTEPPPPVPVVSEWMLSFLSSANVSDYELDELLYDYLQTKGGKKTLELAKPLLYNLLEGLLFPSEDESKDDKGGNATTTTTETSPMTLMLQESLLPLVNVILTPDENGTSSIDDIISVLEPYLNESLGPTVEPPQITGFSLDPETPNGKTFLRLATKFFRTKRITVPLGDYLRQVVELILNKDNSINYKDALLEAAIHAFSCPSSEDLLNELAVFLLKDVILESTDLVSCGLTSALDYLLTALAGKASSSSTDISLPLTDGTMEKLSIPIVIQKIIRKNLGSDIILQALELSDTRKIFRQLKYLFNQSGLPLPGDKLVYVALRAAVTSEGIGSVGGLTFVDLMEAVNASGLKLSSVGESLLLSVATSEDAPPAFFNIFDMFPVLAREVPALSNLPDMNFVDLLADIL